MLIGFSCDLWRGCHPVKFIFAKKKRESLDLILAADIFFELASWIKTDREDLDALQKVAWVF